MTTATTRAMTTEAYERELCGRVASALALSLIHI